MPKLSTLQIGFRDCCRLPLNELVDAAPNLSTLEISACRGCANGWKEMPGVHDRLWEARPSEQPHNLKCLKSGLTLWNTQILQRAVNKFPKLEELWMGAESDGKDPLVRERELKLDSIFHTLEQLNSLKRFDWTSSGPLHLHEFLAGIAEAGERMPSMESVHIRVRYLACPLKSADTAVVANRTHKLLERILVTKQSSCKFILTASYANIFRTERDSSSSSFHLVSFRTGNDLILTFIKRHGLPIQFRPSSTDIY
jgi:hypothetical protein